MLLKIEYKWLRFNIPSQSSLSIHHLHFICLTQTSYLLHSWCSPNKQVACNLWLYIYSVDSVVVSWSVKLLQWNMCKEEYTGEEESHRGGKERRGEKGRWKAKGTKTSDRWLTSRFAAAEQQVGFVTLITPMILSDLRPKGWLFCFPLRFLLFSQL